MLAVYALEQVKQSEVGMHSESAQAPCPCACRPTPIPPLGTAPPSPLVPGQKASYHAMFTMFTIHQVACYCKSNHNTILE